MDQQVRWLWLGLMITSFGWLAYKWVDLTDRQQSGTFNLQQTRSVQSQVNQPVSSPDNGNATAANDVPQMTPSATDSQSSSVPSAPPSDVPTINSAGVPAVNTPVNESDLIHFETDNFTGSISLKGGNLVRLGLKKYPISIKQLDQPTVILQNRINPFTLQSGVISKQVAPNHHAQFASQQKQYTLNSDQQQLSIPLTWRKDGIEVVKTYIFNNKDHSIDIDYKISNQSKQVWNGSIYTQLNRAKPSDEGSSMIYTYTGAAWWSPEGNFKKIDFDDIASDAPSLATQDGWVSMIQHYFLAAIIPPNNTGEGTQGQKNHFYTRQSGQQFIIGTMPSQISIAPGSSYEFANTAFIGPKLQDEIVQTHPTLDFAVDYGIFHVISAPLFWILSKIHDFVGNWAVSIIFITLLIKLIFFKLSEKSYRSMAKMKLLAPRIQQLKERYGDDKQAMNQRMMKIYKEEKVNPLGGCLPVIVQIPVFISLYWVLVESVELRQAPFMLWIQDLSIADPYFVLPVLMGITMFIQQKLNPAPADPMQAKVMQFLPVIFTVFFLFFPAGLVLYWVVNNILSIAQQWYITKRLAENKKS